MTGKHDADVWADLEAKARAATPGPWHTDFSAVQNLWTERGWIGAISSSGMMFAAGLSVQQDRSNAAFIAAANPATILKLIEAARRSSEGEHLRLGLDATGGWVHLKGLSEGYSIPAPDGVAAVVTGDVVVHVQKDGRINGYYDAEGRYFMLSSSGGWSQVVDAARQPVTPDRGEADQ